MPRWGRKGRTVEDDAVDVGSTTGEGFGDRCGEDCRGECEGWDSEGDTHVGKCWRWRWMEIVGVVGLREARDGRKASVGINTTNGRGEPGHVRREASEPDERVGDLTGPGRGSTSFSS